LRGANMQKIRDYGHDQLSTYGIGRDLSVEEWQHLGRSLVRQGLVSENTDSFSILSLNALSREILRKQREVMVEALPQSLQRIQPLQIRPTQTNANLPALTPEEEGLFQQLRALRKQLADERGVAPYVVFPDTSLHTMAQQRPQSQFQFSQIPGVGKQKLEAYYTSFTEEIRLYCELHNLSMGLLPEQELAVKAARRGGSGEDAEGGLLLPPAAGPSLTRQVTLQMYQDGQGIEDIARERNLKPSTIISHLAELIEAGESIDVESLIQPGHFEIIVDALQQIGGEVLKPVKEFLGDEYSYEEIRLVRALLRQMNAGKTIEV
jgi:ATP-dependent DNA helicase RecQ